MHIFNQYLDGKIWQFSLIVFTAIKNEVSKNCVNKQLLTLNW